MLWTYEQNCDKHLAGHQRRGCKKQIIFSEGPAQTEMSDETASLMLDAKAATAWVSEICPVPQHLRQAPAGLRVESPWPVQQ